TVEIFREGVFAMDPLVKRRGAFFQAGGIGNPFRKEEGGLQKEMVPMEFALGTPGTETLAPEPVLHDFTGGRILYVRGGEGFRLGAVSGGEAGIQKGLVQID